MPKTVWHGSENMSYVENIDNKGYEKEAFCDRPLPPTHLRQKKWNPRPVVLNIFLVDSKLYIKNTKTFGDTTGDAHGTEVEKHYRRLLFYNWWATDNFWWASNFVILLSYNSEI